METRSGIQRRRIKVLFTAVALAAIFIPGSFAAGEAAGAEAAPGLTLPKLDAEHGSVLFAEKGCVVCHSVNGIGGINAAPLDASEMDPAGNPFEFFARMLAGMAPMLEMQDERLGHQIELDATELGDIVAFIHNGAVQKSFSLDGVPEDFQKLMEDD
jgi:hypothetical protein